MGQEILVGPGLGRQCGNPANPRHRGRLDAQHSLTFLDSKLQLSNWIPSEQVRPESLTGPAKDARGADWRGLVIGSIDLCGALLCRVDLRGSDLSACSLEGADLRLALYDSNTTFPEEFEIRSTGAVGPGARLNGSFLNGADLRGMDLRGANLMGAYLSGTDLSGCLLDQVRLVGADLRHAVLRGAQCCGARFGGCQLDFADFRGANLSDASLDGAESIKGADFSLTSGLKEQCELLLSRPYEELDCWNPLTRKTTRDSLESIE